MLDCRWSTSSTFESLDFPYVCRYSIIHVGDGLASHLGGEAKLSITSSYSLRSRRKRGRGRGGRTWSCSPSLSPFMPATQATQATETMWAMWACCGLFATLHCLDGDIPYLAWMEILQCKVSCVKKQCNRLEPQTFRPKVI